MTEPRPVDRNHCTVWQPRMVRLIDGREVLNTSELWRQQCEAQHILDMPTKLDRQRVLSLIEEKRGSGKMSKDDPDNMKGKRIRWDIEALIRKLWEARRAAA